MPWIVPFATVTLILASPAPAQVDPVSRAIAEHALLIANAAAVALVRNGYLTATPSGFTAIFNAPGA